MTEKLYLIPSGKHKGMTLEEAVAELEKKDAVAAWLDWATDPCRCEFYKGVTKEAKRLGLIP